VEPRRPDPEALLERVQQEKARRGRGRLKVFFGASAGVGKTYAMLEAARRRKAEGLDVAAGWIETHGRAETASLLSGLELLPARAVDYRGTALREFDLDAALERRPGLLLLDELAHTNAPGSRHAKRWQDAQELLDAGIDVWTTLNVQHLSSLSDIVARITEAPVREIVPDSVLDEASEVEFVDLPPDELLQRLRDGKVYLPEQAQRAVERFFRKGNLTALRELALRRTAERVDEDVLDYRRAHAIDETWPVAERILVCIRPNPESGQLVQAGRRLAARLRAEWIVGYVESPSQPPLSATERAALASAFKLAEQLGAGTAVLSGEDVAGALLDYAREHNVSQIVAGKPARARWRDRLFGSPVDAVVRGSGEIDVHVISARPEPQAPAPARAPRRRAPSSAFAWAVAVVALCTLLCRVLPAGFELSNLIMVYLLGVAFVATRFGRAPSALATALSVAAFDFFFVPPRLTFAVSDTQYFLTFVVMLGVALLISNLAVRVRDHAEAARQRERRTRLLYETSRELGGLSVPDAIASTGRRRVSDVFHGPAVVFLPGPDGTLLPLGEAQPAAGLGPNERAVADWVFRHGRNAGLGTDTLPGATALCVPLPGGERPVGVLCVRPHETLLPLSPEQQDLLETLARLIAAPLEQARLAAAAEKARLEVEAERLRNTLLSSVSHDFRTPLSAITGAASSLLGEAALGGEARADLARTIYEEAGRLNRLVANLLDMTRLESGSLQLRREWQSLEEIVGSAVSRIEKSLDGRRLRIDLPEDLPLVSVDAVLVEQLFFNLLDNAIKYTPAAAAIEISAVRREGELEVAVANDGPPLLPGEERRVFEKFFRRPQAPQGGFGLGLAICRAVVETHAGHIWAENQQPGGVAFRFTLPLGGSPPAAPQDPDELA
jgi:two-component system sensor histidine kinase KdpD